MPLELLTDKQVKGFVIGCTRCDLHKQCTSPVPFRGPSDARIAIMGEAPGEMEDRHRKPFIGPAGKFLEKKLLAVGIKMDDCFIFNTVQCWPHGSPPQYAIDACKVNRVVQLRQTEAKFVLVLGNVALHILEPKLNISQARGEPIERRGKIYFPTVHPSACLRNNKYVRWLEEDLWKFKVLIKNVRN